MLVTIDFLKKNYEKFNNEYFYGKLPNNINFKISNSKKTWGCASYNIRNGKIVADTITISNYYDSPEFVKLNTLLHEMIHIYDYSNFPHHFIQNGKRVGYDAHGTWFKSECERLNKYGWNIDTTATKEEVACSTLSNHSKELINNKIDKALLCVIYGNNGLNFVIKTSTDNISNIITSIKCVNWNKNLGGLKTIKCYKFKNDKIAQMRSSGKRLSGWRYDLITLKNKLQSYYATEVYIDEIHAVISRIKKVNS